MTEAERQHREQVVREALSWVRTPYHHEGRKKGVGVDCAMLIAEVYHVCGMIPWIDPRPYSAQYHLHFEEERYLGFLLEYTRPVSEALPGDLATFQVGHCIAHAGIVIQWPTIVHAYAAAEICTAEDVSCAPAMWKRKRDFLRFKGWEG